MPQPLSTFAVITLAAGATVAGPGLLIQSGHGEGAFSEEGRFIRAQAGELTRYTSQPVSLDRTRHNAIAELLDLLEAHDQDGWDGLQAPALSSHTVYRAIRLLNSLPADVPDPEFAVEPDDGALSVEWFGGFRRMASISLNDSRRFAFTAIQGTNVTQGTYEIAAGLLPAAVLTVITEVCGA